MKTPPSTRLLIPILLAVTPLHAAPPATYNPAPVFEDNFNGPALDATKWEIYDNRGEVSLDTAQGELVLSIKNNGTGTPAWLCGGINATSFAHKYGYHEIRLRVTQGNGVDNCLWFLTSNGSALDDIEIDAPELFTRLVNPYYSLHLYDQRGPVRLDGFKKNYSLTFDRASYQTFGFEWRTDDTIALYRNGTLLTTAAEATQLQAALDGMNGFSAVFPLITTLPLSWLGTPTDGDSMRVDYFRSYQKPGWKGTAGGAWNQAANWGPDGVPGAGKAAVFNQPAPNTSISIPANQGVKSLHFDGSTTPEYAFTGGPLWLGANVRAEGVGGILMTPQVTSTQTIETDIHARRTLQFANLATPDVGAPRELRLEGIISASVTTSPALHFNAVSPIVVTKAIAPSIGSIVKWGEGALSLVADNAFSGSVTLIRGDILINQPGALGTSSHAAGNLVFAPEYDHSTNFIPRLVYTGLADAVIPRGFSLKKFADARIGVTGYGKLTWSGNVAIDPDAIGVARLILEGATRPDNYPTAGVFSGTITDTTVAPLQLEKLGAGAWALTGTVTISGQVHAYGGTLRVFDGAIGRFSAASVRVGSQGTLVFENYGSNSFAPPVQSTAPGNGVIEKRGSGTVTTPLTDFGGSLNITAGTLTIGPGVAKKNVEIAPGATLRLVGSGAWPLPTASGKIINNGTIDVAGWTGNSAEIDALPGHTVP